MAPPAEAPTWSPAPRAALDEPLVREPLEQPEPPQPEPSQPAEPPQWQQPISWEEPQRTGPQPATPPPAPRAPRPSAAEPQFDQSAAAWLAAARRSPGIRPEEQPRPAARVGSRTPQPEVAPEPVAPEPVAPEPVAPEPVAPEPVAAAPSWPPAPATAPAQPQEPAGWPPSGIQLLPKPAQEPAWPSADTVSASMAARSQLDRAQQAEAAEIAAMWMESAEPVMNRGSVRVCYRCSLPLSTHARYCRRCGTGQQG
jgi:ribosomal protein L40E